MGEKVTAKNIHDQLVRDYQNGDHSMLKLLIRSFHPTLKRVLLYYTRNNAVVEDLSQDCWYAIIEQLGDIKIILNFDSWAISIAKRKAIDWIRKKSKSLKEKEEATNWYESLDLYENLDQSSDQKMEIINRYMLLLPDSQKIVLRMFYLDGFSLDEISSTIKVPIGTVKSRLFNARKKLKEIIKSKFENYENE